MTHEYNCDRDYVCVTTTMAMAKTVNMADALANDVAAGALFLSIGLHLQSTQKTINPLQLSMAISNNLAKGRIREKKPGHRPLTETWPKAVQIPWAIPVMLYALNQCPELALGPWLFLELTQVPYVSFVARPAAWTSCANCWNRDTR